MRRKTWAALVAAALSLAGAPADEGAGFASLFDGKSLAGWVPVATDRYLVRNGVIANDGGTGWLRSARPYRNFEFRAEYRVVRQGSDSGVFFRATADSQPTPPGWPVKAYQLQVVDGDSHLMIFGHGTQVTFERKAEALKASQKRAGEWQSLSLKVVGNHAEVALNGAPVTTSDSIALPEGHIGLQGENGQFEWRALAIKELPAR